MTNLARILAKQGKLDDAGRLLQSTLQAQQRKFGPRHPDAAESLYGLACAASLSGSRGAALAHLQQAVETGHVDPARLVREPDFRQLRSEPDFERILTLSRNPARPLP